MTIRKNFWWLFCISTLVGMTPFSGESLCDRAYLYSMSESIKKTCIERPSLAAGIGLGALAATGFAVVTWRAAVRNEKARQAFNLKQEQEEAERKSKNEALSRKIEEDRVNAYQNFNACFTALHNAVQHNNEQPLQTALRNFVSSSTNKLIAEEVRKDLQERLQSLVIEAAPKGNEASVLTLLNHDFEFLDQAEISRNAFVLACKNGHLILASEILKHPKAKSTCCILARDFGPDFCPNKELITFLLNAQVSFYSKHSREVLAFDCNEKNINFLVRATNEFDIPDLLAATHFASFSKDYWLEVFDSRATWGMRPLILKQLYVWQVDPQYYIQYCNSLFKSYRALKRLDAVALEAIVSCMSDASSDDTYKAVFYECFCKNISEFIDTSEEMMALLSQFEKYSISVNDVVYDGKTLGESILKFVPDNLATLATQLLLERGFDPAGRAQKDFDSVAYRIVLDREHHKTLDRCMKQNHEDDGRLTENEQVVTYLATLKSQLEAIPTIREVVKTISERSSYSSLPSYQPMYSSLPNEWDGSYVPLGAFPSYGHRASYAFDAHGNDRPYSRGRLQAAEVRTAFVEDEALGRIKLGLSNSIDYCRSVLNQTNSLLASLNSRRVNDCSISRVDRILSVLGSHNSLIRKRLAQVQSDGVHAFSSMPANNVDIIVRYCSNAPDEDVLPQEVQEAIEGQKKCDKEGQEYIEFMDLSARRMILEKYVWNGGNVSRLKAHAGEAWRWSDSVNPGLVAVFDSFVSKPEFDYFQEYHSRKYPIDKNVQYKIWQRSCWKKDSEKAKEAIDKAENELECRHEHQQELFTAIGTGDKVRAQANLTFYTINSRDENNRTPLHRAVIAQNAEIVELLLNHRGTIKRGKYSEDAVIVDLKLKDYSQKTALDFAREGKNKAIIELLEKAEAAAAQERSTKA